MKILKEMGSIQMLLNLDLVKGPLYIICHLRLKDLIKEAFINELRRGIEVKVPKQLSMNSLSISYRYYDSIINIVKTRMVEKNKSESIE
jgi:hypothetical protein